MKDIDLSKKFYHKNKKAQVEDPAVPEPVAHSEKTDIEDHEEKDN